MVTPISTKLITPSKILISVGQISWLISWRGVFCVHANLDGIANENSDRATLNYVFFVILRWNIDERISKEVIYGSFSHI